MQYEKSIIAEIQGDPNTLWRVESKELVKRKHRDMKTRTDGCIRIQGKSK